MSQKTKGHLKIWRVYFKSALEATCIYLPDGNFGYIFFKINMSAFEEKGNMSAFKYRETAIF